MPVPGDHRMRSPIGEFDRNNGRERLRLFEQNVVEGKHDLLSVQAKFLGHLLDGIKGGSVDIGVADFPETILIGWNLAAFEHTFKRSRTAIHG
jgi:hypothetical protein